MDPGLPRVKIPRDQPQAWLVNLVGLTKEVSSNYNVVPCDMIPGLKATCSFKKIENNGTPLGVVHK